MEGNSEEIPNNLTIKSCGNHNFMYNFSRSCLNECAEKNHLHHRIFFLFPVLVQISKLTRHGMIDIAFLNHDTNFIGRDCIFCATKYTVLRSVVKQHWMVVIHRFKEKISVKPQWFSAGFFTSPVVAKYLHGI